MSKPLAPISESAKNRALQADLNGHRCLIENCTNSHAVELAHVFSRESWIHLVEGLEWSWRMKRNTLNLDTRQNIFYLGASMHELYKQKKWALVPDQDVVTQYFDGRYGMFPLRRNAFPNIEGKVFKYRFLPIDGLEDIVLARQNTDTTGATGSVVVHDYPFDKLPVITSSVHPKYVILHLGQIFGGLPLPRKRLVVEKFPWLRKVRELFLRWTFTVPDDASENESYVDSVSRRSSRDDSCTPPRRIKTSNLPPYTDDHETPYFGDVASSQGKRKRDDSEDLTAANKRQKKVLLTSQFLAQHDGDNESDSALWTHGRISRWVSDFSTPPPAPREISVTIRRSARVQAMLKK